MMDFFLTLFSSTSLTCDFGIYSELAVINRRVFHETFRLFEFSAENTDRSTNEKTLASVNNWRPLISQTVLCGRCYFFMLVRQR
ncbi:unnamed protein product [Lasius platythorax]|uniref:Secreted protein n=1 Tax=Lasius platythorax TaxID=488582 RepID=A0AAV2NCH3_9HYME